MMHSVVITAPVVTDCCHVLSYVVYDAQCCYNSSCGYRLFPCFVVCCVAMHSVVITALVITNCSHVL